MILRLKFGGQRNTAYPLAFLALCGARQVQDAHPAGCVVAVPLHPVRCRERGYNQAELIARQVADFMGLDYLKGVVRRLQNTAPQGTGGGGSRRENVRDVFGPVRDGFLHLMQGEFPGDSVDGRNVLLVDDVISTGATMDYCGRALLDAGALSVTGVAAAT